MDEVREEGYILRFKVKSVVIIACMATDLVCLNDLDSQAIAVDHDITLARINKLRRNPDLLQIFLPLHRVVLQRSQKIVQVGCIHVSQLSFT